MKTKPSDIQFGCVDCDESSDFSSSSINSATSTRGDIIDWSRNIGSAIAIILTILAKADDANAKSMSSANFNEETGRSGIIISGKAPQFLQEGMAESQDGFNKPKTQFQDFLHMSWEEFENQLRDKPLSWDDLTKMLKTLESVGQDFKVVDEFKSLLLNNQILTEDNKEVFITLAKKYNLDFQTIKDIVARGALTPKYRTYLYRQIKSMISAQRHITRLYLNARNWLVKNHRLNEDSVKSGAFKRFEEFLGCHEKPTETDVNKCLDNIQ